MKLRKLLAILLAGLLVCGLLFGCSASTDGFTKQEYNQSNEIKEEAGGTGNVSDTTQNGTATVHPNQKLVRRIWLDAETEDMDALLNDVAQKVTELGGYMESRDVYNGSRYGGRRYRSADLTIRIPADKLDQFVEHVSGNSNITNNKETADDITLSYVATESRITALQAEEKRLLELLAAAENMSDLLQIEQRLTEVRTELEQVQSQLRVYDNQVNYGTIYLSISEVKEYTVTEEPETVWERIGTGFVESLKNLGTFFTELFVALVVGLPYLVLIGAILAAVIIPAKLYLRKKKKTKQDEEK